MNKLYWAFLAVLIGLGLFVTFQLGLQPQSVPKIKPSQVATPEELGAAVAQRLWQEVKDNPLIFLGVDPERADDLRVWKGFLDGLPADIKYKYILVEPRLSNKALIHFDEELDIKTETDRFKKGLAKAKAENIRTAVIVPSFYSSQAIPDNPIQHLKETLGLTPLSLSVAEPTLSRDEEGSAAYPCATGAGDTAGLGSWGCLIQAKSRGLYHKTWTPGKYLGLMDQIGALDYLVLMRLIPPK